MSEDPAPYCASITRRRRNAADPLGGWDPLTASGPAPSSTPPADQVKATTSPEPVAPVKPQENPTAPTSGRLARPLEYAAALAVARAATKKRRTQPMTVTATIARPVMSRQEAAAYLGIALVTFHRLAQGGTIPHVIRGNRRAYLLTDLDAYLRGEAPRSDALRGWDKDPDRVAQGEAMNEARTRGKG